MTIEEKKEYLKSYQRLKKELRSLDEEIQCLRLDQILSGRVLDGMPKGSGGTGDLSGYAAKLDELGQRLKEKAAGLIQRQEAIEAGIDEMGNPVEKALLRNKYLCGLTWEQVAVEMGYSWRQVHNIHSRALQNFGKSA